jgi:hypothetical protein
MQNDHKEFRGYLSQKDSVSLKYSKASIKNIWAGPEGRRVGTQVGNLEIERNERGYREGELSSMRRGREWNSWTSGQT